MGDVVGGIAPVTGRARIEVLDVLRGLAILAIYYMNIAMQASPVTVLMADFRWIGWTPIDRFAWASSRSFSKARSAAYSNCCSAQGSWC